MPLASMSLTYLQPSSSVSIVKFEHVIAGWEVLIMFWRMSLFNDYNCFFLKRMYRGSKEKYPAVSILSVISKISEKLLCSQIKLILDQFLSKYQCGFPKGFNTQHYFLAKLEKWKKAVDTRSVFGALLTDLSKAFDCLSRDCIIAKHNAYGVSLPAFKPNSVLFSQPKTKH